MFPGQGRLHATSFLGRQVLETKQKPEKCLKVPASDTSQSGGDKVRLLAATQPRGRMREGTAVLAVTLLETLHGVPDVAK